VQVNESGIFHAAGYSNLMRQFLPCRIKAFLSLRKYYEYIGDYGAG